MKNTVSRRKKNKISRTEKSNRIHFFLYISPWLIGFAAFTIVPLIMSLVYSFTNVIMANVSTEPLEFVGFANYISIFTKDDDFKKAILNTFMYAAIKVSLIIILSVLFAIILNRKFFGTKTFRVLLYLPAVIPAVSVALLWKLIFTNGSNNVANFILSYLGLGPVDFFKTSASSWATIIFIGVWSGLGPTMLIVLAAIQGVNQELIEASELDGANAFHRFFNIVIPAISKALLFVLLTSLISSLQSYTEVKLLTNGTHDTYTMSLLIVDNAFKTLGNKTLGYACAQGWLVFLFTFVFGLIYVILSKDKTKKDDRYKEINSSRRVTQYESA